MLSALWDWLSSWWSSPEQESSICVSQTINDNNNIRKFIGYEMPQENNRKA